MRFDPAKFVTSIIGGVRTLTLRGGAVGWFNVTDYGAVGDDSTDNHTAFADCLAAMDAHASGGDGVMYIPMDASGGKYRVASQVDIQTVAAKRRIKVLADKGVWVRPVGDIVVFKLKYDNSGDFSSIQHGVTIENVHFEAVTTGQGIGVYEQDCFNTVVTRCTFKNLKWGRVLESYDSWNEGWVDQYNVYQACTKAVRFLMSNVGTGSFQSGRMTGTFIGLPAGGIGIALESGNLYGSLFDMNIWTGGDNSACLDLNGNVDKTTWKGIIDTAGGIGTNMYALRWGASASNATKIDFQMDFAGTYNGGEEENGAVKNASGIPWSHGFLGARATRATDQTITTGTNRAVLFTAEELDAGGWHNTGSNQERFVAPSKGNVACSASVKWDTSTTGKRTLKIRKNGTTIIASVTAPASSGLEQSVAVMATHLADTEYLEILVDQDSGGDVSIIGGGSTQASISRQGMENVAH